MSNTLQRKKLSRQNLEAFQDYLTSLSHPDTVLEWISLASTMTGSDSAGAVSKKRKAVQTASTVPSMIASSRGSEYSRAYTQTLYQLGLLESNKLGIIPSVPSQTEVCKYFSEPTEIPVLSDFMQRWFQEFEPNEETLVHLLGERLFLQKISIPGEPHVAILYGFSGPFEYHDLQGLKRGDEGVKYPFIKHVQDEEEFEYLQTPANEDLRARSDFVFAASINWFERLVQSKIKLIGNSFSVPCVSNNLRSCAVAIAVEVKATASTASILAAKNQWKALAYMQLKERVSINREKSYVGDENICQYGYGICGLEIIIWKMSLQWNRSKHRDSEVLEQDFTFPVETVDAFSLKSSSHLERFITTHKKLLQWWLNGYLPSYIDDLTNIITAHPYFPKKWITSWQQAVATCGCLVNHLPDFLLILAQSSQIPMAKRTAKWMEKATVSKKATKKPRKAKTGSTSLPRKRMTRNMENQTLKSRKRTWRTT